MKNVGFAPDATQPFEVSFAMRMRVYACGSGFAERYPRPAAYALADAADIAHGMARKLSPAINGAQPLHWQRNYP
jgi:hypothetical protein